MPNQELGWTLDPGFRKLRRPLFPDEMPDEIQPSLWMVAPFVVLLGFIALAHVLCPGWWARHYAKVAFGLGAITLVYYFAVLRAPAAVFRTGMDYFSFMCVVGSLYVVAGGIHIEVKPAGSPAASTIFLFIGALAANVLGATGACMLLIRPWLRMNRRRLAGYHVVFFIFVLSNVGGALLPMGPPLFLGYLQGVPFWWVAKACWPMWLTCVGILLGMFWILDTVHHRRARAEQLDPDTGPPRWKFAGLSNLFFAGVILAAVFIKHPPFLREGLMIAASAASYFTTPKSVHETNAFNFHPLVEVAVLFAGIFATMMPALDWLQSNAAQLGQPGPALFFWGSGVLSSVLDNAPTYLSFLHAGFGAFAPPDAVAAVLAYFKVHGTDVSALAAGTPHADEIRTALMSLQRLVPSGLARGDLTVVQVQMAMLLANPLGVKCLQALSMGSVFFGACTYIGNGPNFMVKSIAENRRAPTPTFPGYLFNYTLPFMLPLLIVIWFLFFR